MDDSDMFFSTVTLLILSSLCFALRHEAASNYVITKPGAPRLLEVFQVSPPPLSHEDLLDSTTCSFVLMHHVFENSAGDPYVGMTFLARSFRSRI